VAEKPPEKQGKQGKPDKPDKDPPSQTRTAQEKKRDASLAEFERQVEEGGLVIRQMTPEERDANPPRDRPPKRRPSR
jgi:hypothetical protein